MEDLTRCCKRGRPREFDADAALDAALAVFWRHGYEGASMAALTDAMGINRPSLYAAFGNKEGLFRQVMDRYEQRGVATLAGALAEGPARAGVERLLRGMVDSLTGGCGGGAAGCFLIVSALAGGPAAAAVVAEAARRRAASSPPLLARFQRALADGELPAGTDAAALAGFVKTVMNGLSIQAASGVGRADLHATIDVALRAWPDPPRA